jgi:hypothetical protein
MPDTGTHDESLPLKRRLGTVVWGRRDSRVRASWRVIIATLLLIPPSEVIAITITQSVGLAGPLSVGISQAAIIALVVIGWARYIDRRPLSEYGFSVSGSWVMDLVAGFVAVLVGFSVWLGIGTVSGWADVELVMSASSGVIVVGLVTLLIAVALNAWVQDTVLTGLVIKNGAEGLATRGISPFRAVISAWLVAALLYAWIHNPSAPGQAVHLVLGLGIYGVLYVHTGELALPIGVHTGVNYAAGVLIISPAFGEQSASLFDVTNSLTGVLGGLNDAAVPQILIAYGLLLGWLKLRRGEVGVETELTQWTER